MAAGQWPGSHIGYFPHLKKSSSPILAFINGINDDPPFIRLQFIVLQQLAGYRLDDRPVFLHDSLSLRPQFGFCSTYPLEQTGSILIVARREPS